MLHQLIPDYFVDTIFDIDLRYLQNQGIQGFLFDLDNTLILRGQYQFSDEVWGWLQEIRGQKFSIGIISNSRSPQAVKLAEYYQIPAVFRALKPRRKAFLDVLRLLDLQPSAAAMVGDQLFTDVFGGNRLNLFTILTKPLPGKEFIGTTVFSRQLEKMVWPWVLKHYQSGRRSESSD